MNRFSSLGQAAGGLVLAGTLAGHLLGQIPPIGAWTGWALGTALFALGLTLYRWSGPGAIPRLRPDERETSERVYGHVAAAGSDATLASEKGQHLADLLLQARQRPADAAGLIQEANESVVILNGLLAATCGQLSQAEMAAEELHDRLRHHGTA